MVEYVADLISLGQVILGDDGKNVVQSQGSKHLNVLATNRCNARAADGWALTAATDANGRITLFFRREVV